MPEISGYEACRKIKSIWPSLPVIAQTVFAESIDRARCLDAGFDDYISKSIDIEFLLYKVFTIFNR